MRKLLLNARVPHVADEEPLWVLNIPIHFTLKSGCRFFVWEQGVEVVFLSYDLKNIANLLFEIFSTFLSPPISIGSPICENVKKLMSYLQRKAENVYVYMN